MRTLKMDEVDCVSGGDWDLSFDFAGFHVGVSGPESIQEIVSSAYNATRDAMADFFTWLDPNNYYSSSC